jgi:F-type H+-transporting ATPase subunit delta
MAESVTIARPYALAVFRLARDSGTLAFWSDRLQRLAAIASDPAMAAVIGNPKFSAAQIADLVLSLRGESGASADRELAAFVGILAENERLAVLPQIHELYEQLKSADAGARDAMVTSAYALDDAQLKDLISQLEPHFGSKLQVRVEVDAALIGGIKVVVGDQVLDASVRGKLEAMAAALKN